MGRLAYQNPGWTPACGNVSTTRDPAVLAPAAGELLVVLAAVHHATDAIAGIATQDGLAVRAAAARRHLYMPTRLVPARNTTPRQYSPAPLARVNALLVGYDHAVSTCATATTALDNLVLTADAPSRPLALARRFAEASGAVAPDMTKSRLEVEVTADTAVWPTSRTQQDGRRRSL